MLGNFKWCSCVLALVLAACGDDGGGNLAPEISDLSLTTMEDTPISAALVVTDAEGDALTVTVGPPFHGTATVVGSTVTYTPTENFVGPDTFSVVVTDGTSEVTGSVTITVTPVNDAPVGVDDAFATDEDVALVLPASALLANDRDVDADPLTLTAVGSAVNGTVDLVASDVVFTPAVDFTGTATFEYTLSDGTSEATATVTVTVGGVNDPPVAADDAATTAEDTAAVLAASTLLANDTDPEAQTLTVTAVGNATNGTVVLDVGTGMITFTPAADFNGTASFAYTVSDGVATDTGAVTVTVTPVNDAPVATDDAANTTEDTALVIAATSLTANDVDVDADPLAVTSVGNAVNGTVTLASGSVTFTPAADFAGAAGFTYTVSDGLLTDTGAVTVTVAPVNDAPVAVDDAAGADASAPNVYPVAQFLANDTDADGDTLSITAVQDATNGTVALAAGAITYTAPSPTFAGTATFTYTVSDGNGGSDTGLVTLTVVASSVCGDGAIFGAEACDDSDLDPGDGCSATCEVEPGFTCTGAPSVCTPVCGDGMIRGSEACDDGGSAAGDGCSATCTVEPGFTCAGEPTSCTTICGDGIVTFDEQCDDGNLVDTDGCTSQCVLAVTCDATARPGADRFAVDPVTGTCYAAFDGEQTTFGAAQTACIAAGGHLATITSSGEQALVVSVQNDAENPWIGGSDAAVEGTFTWVTGEPFAFTSFAPGQPDDDATIGGDGDCLHLVDAAGAWNDTNCNLDTFVTGRICELPLDVCGDGFVQASRGEGCDDGNATNGDGCSAICQVETLFFSEYLEGSASNKAVELRNPSASAAFDLAANTCAVRLYTNGAAAPSQTVALAGSIAANDVFVLCHPSANAAVLAVCDQLSSAVMNHNGDDALELVCGGATVDVIGQIGLDPGTEWGTGLTSTADNTLRRRCQFRAGDTDGSNVFDPATEWDGFAIDTFDGLGVAECVP